MEKQSIEKVMIEYKRLLTKDFCKKYVKIGKYIHEQIGNIKIDKG
jgi:hypothetical protein